MSYDSCKNIGWFSLLDGASKFELVDLLIAIESYLIDKQNEWIQQNILTVHKYAAICNLFRQTFGLLQSNYGFPPGYHL